MSGVYEIKHAGHHWSILKSTHYRRGAAVPTQGWRSAGNATFVDESDRYFDKELNFACAEIGSLASNVKSKAYAKENFSKTTLFYVNGFASYTEIKRPCHK